MYRPKLKGKDDIQVYKERFVNVLRESRGAYDFLERFGDRSLDQVPKHFDTTRALLGIAFVGNAEGAQKLDCERIGPELR